MIIDNFVVLNILVLILLNFCFGKNKVDTSSAPKIKFSSPVFGHQEPIPAKYTCQGEEISPPLNWEKGPDGTKSYAIIATDPDAPIPFVTITHWVLYNIPGDQTSLEEDQPPGKELEKGIRQGKRSFGDHSYMGPCPPFGEHRYFFRIYALDTKLDLAPEKASRKKLLKAMQGHILGFGKIYGVYSKK